MVFFLFRMGLDNQTGLISAGRPLVFLQVKPRALSQFSALFASKLLGFFEQVGAAFLCDFKALGAPPGLDFAVIAGF
jgi:hypothetical protein